MTYTKFTIEHYRAYKSKQTIEFGLPQAGKAGSGITYIVGENNSGKTTLIEGLYLKKGEKIRNSEFQSSGSPIFTLYDGETVMRRVELLREGSSTLTESPTVDIANSFEIIASRRHWASDVQQAYSISQLTGSERFSAVRNTNISSELNSIMSGIFAQIEQDTDLYNSFIKEVQKVLPDFTGFSVGYEILDYINYRTSDGAQHRSDMLGDGVISILRIFAHLAVQTSTRPLVIDEPELSLHPSAQNRLRKVLESHSTERQIIISTHSPYLISWEAISNGAKLNRVVKPNDATSMIYTLKDYSCYASLLAGANWRQPFLMDTVAKEVFFNDNLLFLEGQEDVGLLNSGSYLSESINLFGYGVRGYTSFAVALKLAQDLGIAKAAVIIDGGEAESEFVSTLTSKFPGYKIIQWKYPDIRDKPAYTSTPKNGYFTEKGELKPTYQLADFEQKLSEINSYFSS